MSMVAMTSLRRWPLALTGASSSVAGGSDALEPAAEHEQRPEHVTVIRPGGVLLDEHGGRIGTQEALVLHAAVLHTAADERKQWSPQPCRGWHSEGRFLHSVPLFTQ